jgi:DNA repair ATPase RecN
MFQKQGFVDHSLIKIKDRLSEASTAKSAPKNEKDALQQQEAGIGAPHLVSATPPPPPLPSGGTKTAFASAVRDETVAALSKRKEEFRLLKRDISEKFAEKLSSFPEDIRVTERRIEELKSATEKFATLIDELKGIDEHCWDENTPHSEIGRACRKAENARLEFIRVCARLSALQRESSAAEEMDSGRGGGSIVHELSSMSFKQGLKMGFLLSLPLVAAILAGAVILAIGYIIALKL